MITDFSYSSAATVADRPAVVFTRREAILEELAEARGQEFNAEVQLDFSRITSVGSLELSALIRFCLSMHYRRVQVLLVGVTPALVELFEITRFTRLAELRN